jgi:hypothetical protein
LMASYRAMMDSTLSNCRLYSWMRFTCKGVCACACVRVCVCVWVCGWVGGRRRGLAARVDAPVAGAGTGRGRSQRPPRGVAPRPEGRRAVVASTPALVRRVVLVGAAPTCTSHSASVETATPVSSRIWGCFGRGWGWMVWRGGVDARV